MYCDDCVILVYAIHTPFLKACVEAKKRHKNLKIILIVPDLPEFMSQKSNPIRNLLQLLNQRTLDGLYKYVDGYVLLSEFMTDRLPVGDKPWEVVEGIFNQLDEKKMTNEENVESDKYILYTGTLARRYGIMNLVEAFHRLTMQDVKLFICGDGDTKNEIIDFAKKDSRIIYKGLVRREDAMVLQKNALLLVNPRTPEGEFTKYSFPSKTMEYLASGTPTLLYRLPGIPNEYYDYCYGLSDLSIEALTYKLNEILSIDKEELKALGIRARNFILEKKNPKQQTKKIIDLIHKL
jgi:glycosyltransferase involved in cell wall biosynthesis